MQRGLVGSEMCIRDRYQRRVHGTNCTRIRFWGQYLCKEQDYFVIEMKANPDEGYASIPGEEPRGRGVNENVYWVTNDLLGEWHKLPDVQAKDIVAARQIKKVLTGKLDAPVKSFPFFEGKEEALLRAQIARITASTVIVPMGIYKANEENPREIDLEEAPALPTFAELKGTDKWVHKSVNILKNGRTAHVAPPGNPEPEAYIEKEKELSLIHI
eukprot:TRINITY_DN12280_c0_g1_i4.p1 TRINITY_DN12280_c0_g1~~TRINITY_DN12280_c0_g1_i4.p1  ORF type:complete len:214 (-),score=57.82 TRINITY_DN12280_c0_g1_i4:151-792(-)